MKSWTKNIHRRAPYHLVRDADADDAEVAQRKKVPRPQESGAEVKAGPSRFGARDDSRAFVTVVLS